MELNEKRMYVSISAGTLCLLIGLGQLLYALLALVSVVFVDILGLGLTVASVAVAAVPDKPIEVPYARTLATTIGLIGAAFGIVCFVVGPISFFQRRSPTIGLAVCVLFCVVLSFIHFANSLTFGASVYIFVGLLFSLAIASDQAITRLSVASP